MGQNLDAALVDCSEALKLQPDDPYTRDNLGLIYLKQKQYSKAIAEYDASLKLDPNRARALYGRGLARSKKDEDLPVLPICRRLLASSRTSATSSTATACAKPEGATLRVQSRHRFP